MGFAVASREVIEFVKHTGRAIIFSASAPPPAIAAALAALDIIESEPDRRQKLWQNVARMQEALTDLGYDVGKSRSAIIPIRIGGDIETFQFWRRLHDEGVFTNPVVPPAVPPDEGMIRTSYMATHTFAELDKVAEVFARLGRAAGLLKVA